MSNALVPAAYDVEPEAAFADVVGGDEFLGGDEGRDQRRVHRAEHGQPLGIGGQPAGPGDGLEGGALVIGVAAIALPSADRQHELDAGGVRHPRQVQAIRPAAQPAFRHRRHRPAGRAVGAEQPELQPVATAHRGAFGLSDRALHHCPRCGAGKALPKRAGIAKLSLTKRPKMPPFSGSDGGNDGEQRQILSVCRPGG
jgi:hypothetical protein